MTTYPLAPSFVADVRRTFDVQGYVIIPNALDPAHLGRLRSYLDGVELPATGNWGPLLDKGDDFLSLADNPAVFPHVLALLGGNLQVLTSHVTVLPPNAGPSQWHEDGPRPWPYPAVDGRRPLLLLRVGYFMEDISVPERGNVVCLPGSHNVSFNRSGDPDALWKHPALKTLTAPEGSAVLFHQALWHSTSPNRVDSPRRALYLAYGPTWHRQYDWIQPPDELLARVDALPSPRRELLRQLSGAMPSTGLHGYYFPEPREFPAMTMLPDSDQRRSPDIRYG